MSEKRKYDSTVARIAGNLLSGAPKEWLYVSERSKQVATAVQVARMIVEETQLTEPQPDPPRPTEGQ